MRIDISTNNFTRVVQQQFNYVDSFVKERLMLDVLQYIPYSEWPKLINHPVIGTIAQSMLKNPDGLKQAKASLDIIEEIRLDLLNSISEFKTKIDKANQLLETICGTIDDSDGPQEPTQSFP